MLQATFRLLAVASLASLIACVADRQRLGDIRLRPYGNIQASLSSFSVQQGRILSPDLDLTVEADGCIRIGRPLDDPALPEGHADCAA